MLPDTIAWRSKQEFSQESGSADVLPVGGIKEKVLAAHNAGVKHIILPAQNEKDRDEIPARMKANLSFHFVRHIDDVLKLALVNPN